MSNFVLDYDNEFDQIYPDYEDYDTPDNGIQVHKQGSPDYPGQ